MAKRTITVCDRCGKVVDEPVVFERRVSRARTFAEDDNEDVHQHHACPGCATYLLRAIEEGARAVFHQAFIDAKFKTESAR